MTIPAREGQPFLREAAEEMEAKGFDFLMAGILKDIEKELAENIVKNIKINLEF